MCLFACACLGVCVSVCMQWRLHYTLVFRHIQQRCRVDGCHNSCPTAGASRESDTDSNSSPSCCNYNWTPHATAAMCSCLRARVCLSVSVCVSACVLNIAIYHANAFFNFNMPPGIIKTLQTYNMSQHRESESERRRERRVRHVEPPTKNPKGSGKSTTRCPR